MGISSSNDGYLKWVEKIMEKDLSTLPKIILNPFENLDNLSYRSGAFVVCTLQMACEGRVDSCYELTQYSHFNC